MQNKNINFTKYKLFPIWNYTVESNIDNYKIEISKNDDEINIYKYGELKNKVLNLMNKKSYTFIDINSLKYLLTFVSGIAVL